MNANRSLILLPVWIVMVGCHDSKGTRAPEPIAQKAVTTETVKTAAPPAAEPTLTQQAPAPRPAANEQLYRALRLLNGLYILRFYHQIDYTRGIAETRQRLERLDQASA